MQRIKQENEDNSLSWLNIRTQACPRCKARIEKNGGCNHMTCGSCRHHFCWLCLGDWSQHNNATGGYYACNRYDARATAESSRNSANAIGQASLLSKGLMKVVKTRIEAMRIPHYTKRYVVHEDFCMDTINAVAAEIEQLLQNVGLRLDCAADSPVHPSAGEATAGRAEDATDAATAPSTSRPSAPGRSLVEELGDTLPETHKLLANSYVLAWFMWWGRGKQYFEHLQGTLEQYAENLASPFAAFPDESSAGAAFHDSGHHWQGLGLQAQKFYHAAVIHQRRQQVHVKIEELRWQMQGLTRMAQRGVFAGACAPSGREQLPS